MPVTFRKKAGEAVATKVLVQSATRAAPMAAAVAPTVAVGKTRAAVTKDEDPRIFKPSAESHKDKPMIKVYGDMLSGNCFKVKLILELTGEAHEWLHTDVVKGDTRTPEFLKKNANGRIPLVEFEDGSFMPESNALLFYFAQGSDYWPQNIRQQAEVLQWMFFEQYP
jgi:hypothetical protein